MNTHSQNKPQQGVEGRRTRRARPYPMHELEQALAVAVAIRESNAGLPFDRVLLAKALGTTPASSGYTMKLNSSAKYGLTRGGYTDPVIKLTPRGNAIVAPQDSDELRVALIEAAVEPDLFDRFYRTLDGRSIPKDTYALNLLQRELGVHPSLADECLRVIKANGLYVGILSEIEGSLVVNFKGSPGLSMDPVGLVGSRPGTIEAGETARGADHVTLANGTPRTGKVFIGHSGISEAVHFVCQVLDDFDIPYGVVEVDADDIQPVSVQVCNEMRGCSAGILVFDNSEHEQEERPRADERMLYQLGAASVLYNNRIVILREARVQMAGHFQGLHQIVFDSEHMEKSGLDLLRELHRARVIDVIM